MECFLLSRAAILPRAQNWRGEPRWKQGGTGEPRKEGREEEIRKKCRGLSVALCRSSSSQKKKENVYKMFAPSELATIRGGGQCVAGT